MEIEKSSFSAFGGFGKVLKQPANYWYICLPEVNEIVLFFFLCLSRPEEESSSSSSDEDEDDRKQTDELLGKVVCVDYVSLDKKKSMWFPALVSILNIKDLNPLFKKKIFIESGSGETQKLGALALLLEALSSSSVPNNHRWLTAL